MWLTTREAALPRGAERAVAPLCAENENAAATRGPMNAPSLLSAVFGAHSWMRWPMGASHSWADERRLDAKAGDSNRSVHSLGSLDGGSTSA